MTKTLPAVPNHRRRGKKYFSPLTAEENDGVLDKCSSDVEAGTKSPEKTLSSGEKKKSLSKKTKKRAREELENLEEQRLTALIFGGNNDQSDDVFDDTLKQFKRADDKNKIKDDEQNFEFEIDRDGLIDNENDKHNDIISGRSKALNQAWNDEDDDEVDSDDDDHDGREADFQTSAAWEDEDDAKIKLVDGSSRLKKLRLSLSEKDYIKCDELEQRLRKRYESSSYATALTSWAAAPSASSSGYNNKVARYNDRKNNFDAHPDDVDVAASKLFSTSKALLASSRYELPPNVLNIVRCPDANLKDPNKAVVRCIDFHPGSDPHQPLMLTAGLDKTLRFFQVGEEKSEKIHGIHFPKMPIYSASFLGDTGKVVLCGRRKFFYFYDAVTGKADLVPKIHGRDERSWEKHTVSSDGSLVAFVGNDGYIVLVDSYSKQCIGNLKLNGSVRAVAFSPDGNNLIASGSDGDIYRWDVKSRRCIERFPNGDGTITSSLAASVTNLAVGAESGVVNIYSDGHIQKQYRSSTSGIVTKTPLKSIMNLHTSADKVEFNSDGQILAMSSQREKHGLKILHVPTRTVFSNWPTAQTPLGYVWSVKFSPKSKFIAIGNDKGKCLLYKINHYNS